MRLQPKHIIPAVMAIIMAFLMTGFLTWLHLGVQPDFLWQWMRSFLIAWPLATAAAYVAAPLALKTSLKIIGKIHGPA